MKKKIALSFLALVLVAGGVSALAACESHIISITAKISQEAAINVKNIDFGTVSPLSKTNKNFTISLSGTAITTDSDDEDADETSSTTCNAINLITNGSFETPVVTNPAKWDVFPTGTAGLGWTVNWASTTTTFNGQTRPVNALLELQNKFSGWMAQDGNQYAELDSAWGGPNSGLPGNAPALVSIYQNISTITGQKYKLTYFFSPRPGTGANENDVIVKINGQKVQEETASGTSLTQPNWMPFQVEFTATGSSTKIEFVGGGVADGLGNFLDNVKVTQENCPTPTPTEKIKYTIAQKPVCVNKNDSDDRVPAQQKDDEFKCPSGYVKMPVLCPYLSKTAVNPTSDTKSIPAFHGSVSDWNVKDTNDNLAKGALTSSHNQDTWTIDLEAPCIKGSCPSNFAHKGFELDSSLAGKEMGCDLVISVMGGDDNSCSNVDVTANM